MSLRQYGQIIEVLSIEDRLASIAAFGAGWRTRPLVRTWRTGVGGAITMVGATTFNFILPMAFGAAAVPRLGAAFTVVFTVSILLSSGQYGFLSSTVEGMAEELFDSIHDGIVAVGAMRDDHFGDSSGSAYLFDAATAERMAQHFVQLAESIVRERYARGEIDQAEYERLLGGLRR